MILGSRNKERGEQAIQDIGNVIGIEKCQKRLELLVIDTASSTSVQSAADEFTTRYPTPPALYGIINNAGVRTCIFKK